MIEILQNKENFDKIEFNARDGIENLGKVAGELVGDAFVIDELECGEDFADSLVRAILNMMALHGIDKARFELPERQTELLCRLKFFKDEPKIDSIAEFFDKGCCK